MNGSADRAIEATKAAMLSEHEDVTRTIVMSSNMPH